jgi:hypothetical protein
MKSGPINLRETFELFRFYRPDVGLKRLLQDTEIASMNVRQIYHAVHDRPPDARAIATAQNGHNAMETFMAALCSLEFQENIITHFLKAFPEKRRLFFVHIPKTAGVSTATRLISRFPSLNTNLLDRTLTPTREELFLAIKHVILEMAGSDTIFISGHTSLGMYQKWAGNGIRFQDRVFTVVREPMARIVSQINYVLTRIFSEAETPQPDTIGWRRTFDVLDLHSHRDRSAVLRLAWEILRNPGVTTPDVLCKFIGEGDYESAVTKTVAHGLEVVDMDRLDLWSEQQWGASEADKLNVSWKFVSLADFPPGELEYARSIVANDLRYYERVLDAMDRLQRPSIRGDEILLACDGAPTPRAYGQLYLDHEMVQSCAS